MTRSRVRIDGDVADGDVSLEISSHVTNIGRGEQMKRERAVKGLEWSEVVLFDLHLPLMAIAGSL